MSEVGDVAPKGIPIESPALTILSFDRADGNDQTSVAIFVDGKRYGIEHFADLVMLRRALAPIMWKIRFFAVFDAFDGKWQKVVDWFEASAPHE